MGCLGLLIIGLAVGTLTSAVWGWMAIGVGLVLLSLMYEGS